MTQSIELENIKGSAEPGRISSAQRLFGANGAGMSSAREVVRYPYEDLYRGSAAVHGAELDRNPIELGRLARVGWRDEADRSILLRPELTTPGGLECVGRKLRDFRFPWHLEAGSGWLAITNSLGTTTFRGSLVERGVTGGNNARGPRAWIETACPLRGGDPLQRTLSVGYPIPRFQATPCSQHL